MAPQTVWMAPPTPYTYPTLLLATFGPHSWVVGGVEKHLFFVVVLGVLKNTVFLHVVGSSRFTS